MELIIDISEKKIKILEGKLARGKIVIANTFSIDDVDCVFENGRILNANELGTTIQKALKKNGIRTKKASIIMRSSDFLAKELSLPKAGKRKIFKMTETSFDTQIHLPHHYIDCYVNYTYKEEENEFYKVTAYAIRKDIVQSYHTVLKAAKLKPLRLDLERNAIRKLVRSKEKINTDVLPKVSLFIDLTFVSLTLNVIVDTKPVFSKEIRYRSNVLQLFSDNEKRDEKEASAAFLRLLNEEAYKMMQFAMSNAIKQPLSKVYIFGLKNEGMHYIARVMKDALGIDVELVESISQIENIPQLSEFLIPLSSLYPCDDIMFFDQVRKEESHKKKPSPLFYLILHYVILLAIGFGLFAYMDLSEKRNLALVAAEEVRITALQNSRQGDYEQTEKAMLENKALIESLTEQKNRSKHGLSLRAEYITDILFQYKTDAITFTSLSYSSGTFRVSALAEDKLATANYCSRLEQDERVDHVTYNGIYETSSGYTSDITISVRSVSEDE